MKCGEHAHEAGPLNGAEARGSVDGLDELYQKSELEITEHEEPEERAGRARPAACPRAAFEMVQAVHTLAHEAVHLAGVRNEAEAECYGLQAVDLVAVRLEADRTTARALADYAFARLYPSLPPHYRTDACRDGGPLDLVPGSATFP